MPRGSFHAAMMEENDSSGMDGAAGLRFLSGTCPDPKCQSRLYCMSRYQSIECTGCGQMHAQSALLNVREEKGDIYNKAFFAIKSLITSCKPGPGTDNVKVHGLSNYLCKLLSHLLSRYGMDRSTSRPKLLTEMGLPEIFNCGLLCERAFHIDSEHLSIAGYGRDRSGAEEYLADTLNVAREINDNDDRLIPIHADGDGHCLVHAVSRALVGRELFWHPLRLNLMQHFRDNLQRYKDLFNNFVDVNEWDDIINECMPNFVPKDGEPVGLRNIHIFGLANVLKRPIILLDSMSGIQSSGDYSAVFLPALLKPEECKNKENTLNYPLCIAWSSQGRNHFIALVGVKDKPCPRLPRCMMQKTWGVHESMVDQYMVFDEQGCCKIGGTRAWNENYIQRLVSAMEEVFFEKYQVKPALVADVHQYIFRSKGLVGVTLDMETEKTNQLVTNRALVRCIRCSSLTALPEVSPEWFMKGGRLYELALKEIGELNVSKVYTFTDYHMSCRYNAEKDCLVPDLTETRCEFCQSTNKLRFVCADGAVEYHEGDVTLEPAGPNSRCSCGFKHYYSGRFYDNRPREFLVPLEWGGKHKLETVQWWEKESDPELNSNVYQVANDLVLKYFPGEFGIERLQQKIVQAILTLTASQDAKEVEQCEEGGLNGLGKWNAEEASKIILSGFQSQGIHKEELTMSESERQVKKKIETNAPQQQAKKTGDTSTAAASASASASAGRKNSPLRTSITKTKASSVGPSAPSSPSSTSTPKSSSSRPQSGTSTPPKSATPPLSSTPKAATASKEKKIRIMAAGGCANTVTLTEDVTYAKLQQVVFEAVKVPTEHQKLRLGFPPKILTPPAPGHEDDIVQISHSDKITVENTAETQAASGSSSLPSPRRSLRGHVDAHMPKDEGMLNILSAKHSGGDGLDACLLSLSLMAENMGKDLWEVVQAHPHHFSQGGLYYLQAKRDVGLVPDKHFTFPALPGKTFVYNGALDRLELCVNGLGHFEVEADVEKKANEMSKRGGIPPGHIHHSSTSSRHSTGGVVQIWHEDSGPASFGSSGAITKHMNQHSLLQGGVFKGLGHSLRDPATDDKMPEDVSLSENIQGAARRLQEFCHPEQNPHSSIAEEPEKMEMEMGKGSSASKGDQEEGYRLPKYTRKGPGFSVLEPASPPEQTPLDRTSSEMHQLFQNLQDMVDMVAGRETIEEDGEQEKEAEQKQQAAASEKTAEDDIGMTSQDEGMDEVMETT